MVLTNQVCNLILYSGLALPRPNIEELRSSLLDLGANEVVTEEFARSYKMKELLQVLVVH